MDRDRDRDRPRDTGRGYSRDDKGSERDDRGPANPRVDGGDRGSGGGGRSHYDAPPDYNR